MSLGDYDEISSHQCLWEVFIIDPTLFRILIERSGGSIKKAVSHQKQPGICGEMTKSRLDKSIV